MFVVQSYSMSRTWGASGDLPIVLVSGTQYRRATLIIYWHTMEYSAREFHGPEPATSWTPGAYTALKRTYTVDNIAWGARPLQPSFIRWSHWLRRTLCLHIIYTYSTMTLYKFYEINIWCTQHQTSTIYLSSAKVTSISYYCSSALHSL